MVTVTSASQSAPSLFPLIPSTSSIPDSGDITIGCLAKDFLPDTLTFSWQKPDNGSLEPSSVKRFPSMSSSGTFTVSSEATVPSGQWKTFEPFYCKAEHPSATKVARVVRQTPVTCEDPEVTVRVPPLEEFLGPYQNATILCKADHLHTERTTIKWLMNGKELTSDFTTGAPFKGRGGFSIISELIVTKRNWFAEKVFSCQVQNEKINLIRNVSKASVCQETECSSEKVRVETIPPSYADIFLNQSVKLTCRVSNLPYGPDGVDMLNVSWTRSPDNKPLETIVGEPKEQEGSALVFVEATATICLEEWNRGDTFTCKVTHPLLVTTETKTLKKQIGGPRKAPSVYVLPPPSEQLVLHEKATLTCLLEGFFPGDFFVQWIWNNKPVDPSEYHTSKPIKGSKTTETYFAYSTLNVDEQEWSSGAQATCMVGHEAIHFQTTQKTIDKNTAYLDGIVTVDDDEGLLNISSILSTFIILFLVSLFYSATVTVIKVK